MTTQNTTPRPWCEIETPHWTLGIGSLQAMKVIASVPAGSDTGAGDRALIVRAVNAHEAHQELANLCVGILECLEQGDLWNKSARKHAAELLRATLEKAGAL